eukprot:scaffold36436_cov24-Tisochrysis_lutea.AAC.1
MRVGFRTGADWLGPCHGFASRKGKRCILAHMPFVAYTVVNVLLCSIVLSVFCLVAYCCQSSACYAWDVLCDMVGQGSAYSA